MHVSIPWTNCTKFVIANQFFLMGVHIPHRVRNSNWVMFNVSFLKVAFTCNNRHHPTISWTSLPLFFKLFACNNETLPQVIREMFLLLSFNKIVFYHKKNEIWSPKEHYSCKLVCSYFDHLYSLYCQCGIV